ncbi:MAG TPA: DUF2520 domain-containing protein [Thermoanaerobaculales bacterium]|nr:DUF2520 domain-containing protein [Thermoanaerobaculales bacterium]HQL29079.1 DUF2520 domain-containing protein [Thermoanaerobaculales bacterium]
MGQVPSDDAPYLLVGSGRLSRHLQHYFDLEGIRWRLWARAMGEPLESSIPGCRAALLLIADDAIESFLGRHARPGGPPWVHCSGSLATPLATGVHPLMTFGDELYDRADYRRMAFVCDRGGRPFEELFPRLPNPHFEIDPADRPLYHALCAMAGNFTTLLWQNAFAAFEDRLSLARSALHPYLERVAANLERSASPLTGPLARGDRRTIERHLAALEGDPFREVYQSFVAAHRATASGEQP